MRNSKRFALILVIGVFVSGTALAGESKCLQPDGIKNFSSRIRLVTGLEKNYRERAKEMQAHADGQRRVAVASTTALGTGVGAGAVTAGFIAAGGAIGGAGATASLAKMGTAGAIGAAELESVSVAAAISFALSAGTAAAIPVGHKASFSPSSVLKELQDSHAKIDAKYAPKESKVPRALTFGWRDAEELKNEALAATEHADAYAAEARLLQFLLNEKLECLAKGRTSISSSRTKSVPMLAPHEEALFSSSAVAAKPF